MARELCADTGVANDDVEGAFRWCVGAEGGRCTLEFPEFEFVDDW